MRVGLLANNTTNTNAVAVTEANHPRSQNAVAVTIVAFEEGSLINVLVDVNAVGVPLFGVLFIPFTPAPGGVPTAFRAMRVLWVRLGKFMTGH